MPSQYPETLDIEAVADMTDPIPQGHLALTDAWAAFRDSLWRGHDAVAELHGLSGLRNVSMTVAARNKAAFDRIRNLELQAMLRPFRDGALEALVMPPGEQQMFTIPKSAWENAFYPERMFLDSTIAAGHGEYWDALEGRSPFVSEKTFQSWLGSRDVTIVKLLGDVEDLGCELRPVLVDLAQDGIVPSTEAETLARRFGVGPLAKEPPAGSFDPMLAEHWTLPMVIAWMVWRKPEKVREQWDDYRNECLAWAPLGASADDREGDSMRHGETLQQPPPASVALIGIAEAAGEDDSPKLMSVRTAIADLWKRLESGGVSGNAVDRDRKSVVIGKRDWARLDLAHELGGPDYLVLKTDTLSRQYTDLIFSRLEVLRHWRPLPSDGRLYQAGTVFQFDDDASHWSLFEASVWVGCEGEQLSTDEIEARGLDDQGANELFRALHRNPRLNATGINRQLIREPIPREYWELATVDLMARGHRVEFIDDEAEGLHGTLTPFSESEPRWTRIDIDVAELKKVFSFGRSRPASCRHWLEQQMRESPRERPKSKAAFLSEAVAEFNVTKADFNRAWQAALENIKEAKGIWDKAGRPKSVENNRSAK
ncbi:MAG TPA: hypothetical protein VIL84_07890 [Devosiaceae bacterium]